MANDESDAEFPRHKGNDDTPGEESSESRDTSASSTTPGRDWSKVWRNAAASAAVGAAAATGGAYFCPAATTTATSATTFVAGATAAGAAVGGAIWSAVVPVASLVGFTSSGIASGSLAAGLMSMAATASGGGVASGSFVAACQSIGALGAIATPLGLGIVVGTAVVGGAAAFMSAPATTVVAAVSPWTRAAAGAAIGGAGSLVKSYFSNERRWVLVEVRGENATTSVFDDEDKARAAYEASTVTLKKLVGPEDEEGWDEFIRAVGERTTPNQDLAV